MRAKPRPKAATRRLLRRTTPQKPNRQPTPRLPPAKQQPKTHLVARPTNNSAATAAATRRAILGALLVAVAAAFLLAGYEFARSSANTLFKDAYGKEALPIATAALPFAVIVALFIYGRLLSATGVKRTLLITSAASALLLCMCGAAIDAGYHWAAAVLFVAKEIYVVLIIEQYWSFLNSTIGSDLAKRMNGPICGISSIGAIIAGLAVGELASRVGTNQLVIIAGVLTLPAILLSQLAFRCCGEPKSHHVVSTARDTLGLSLFRSEPILPLIFATVVISQVVAMTLDFNFQGVLHDAIPNVDEQTAYSGRFFALLNASALLIQFLIAPLLLRRFNAATIMLLIPMVHVATCCLFLLDSSLMYAGAAFMIFKVFDYSIFRAAKEILYIPLSFDVRYRAKEMIDVFGYRSSKGVTSIGIATAQRLGVVFSDTIYTSIAAIAVGLWVLVAVRLRKKISSS